MNRLPLMFCLWMALSTCGCENQNGYKPTEEDRRVLRAYASLTVLYESFHPTAAPDSVALYQNRVDSILASFELTRQQFRLEFENLINTPERLQPLFQELSDEILKEMRKR